MYEYAYTYMYIHTYMYEISTRRTRILWAENHEAIIYVMYLCTACPKLNSNQPFNAKIAKVFREMCVNKLTYLCKFS